MISLYGFKGVFTNWKLPIYNILIPNTFNNNNIGSNEILLVYFYGDLQL